MSKLTPQQQKVLADFDVAIARHHASPIERKALVEAGLVESDLRDLPGGDADSEGALQERRSIYGPNRGPRRQADRFLTDARKLKRRGMSAGELAQAVQRSAFPERYDQRSSEAEGLLRRRGHGGSAGSSTPSRLDPGRAPRLVRGGTEVDTEGALVDSLLAGKRGRRGRSLLKDLSERVDTGEYTTVTPSRVIDGRSPRYIKGREGVGVRSAKGGRFDIKELFWQGAGGIDIKNGKRVPQGFVSGHTDHVHVASGPKQVERLAKLAASMGLRVGEDPQHGGVHPVHAKNSYHYRNQAIDVSGSPAAMRRFAHAVARRRR